MILIWESMALNPRTAWYTRSLSCHRALCQFHTDGLATAQALPWQMADSSGAPGAVVVALNLKLLAVWAQRSKKPEQRVHDNHKNSRNKLVPEEPSCQRTEQYPLNPNPATEPWRHSGLLDSLGWTQVCPKFNH